MDNTTHIIFIFSGQPKQEFRDRGHDGLKVYYHGFTLNL